MKECKQHRSIQESLIATTVAVLLACQTSYAAPIAVTNFSFEMGNTIKDFPVGEFYIGGMVGWSVSNPFSPGGEMFIGSLDPEFSGTEWFSEPTPEGDRVLLLYYRHQEGDFGIKRPQEFGVEQELDETLQAGMVYTLQVDVGNIQSGGIYDLDGFPGYRVQLLAGGHCLAEDVSSLTIHEGEWEASTVVFQVPDSHDLIGEPLGIRLVNINPNAYFIESATGESEVDFDNVRLDESAAGPPQFTPVITALAWPADGFENTFEIVGKGTKDLLIVGRGLSQHPNVPHRIRDPYLTLSNGKTILAENDDAPSIPQLPDLDPEDAAINVSLGPGVYTATLTSDYLNESGYARFEIYDLNPESNAQLIRSNP